MIKAFFKLSILRLPYKTLQPECGSCACGIRSLIKTFYQQVVVNRPTRYEYLIMNIVVDARSERRLRMRSHGELGEYFGSITFGVGNYKSVHLIKDDSIALNVGNICRIPIHS